LEVGDAILAIDGIYLFTVEELTANVHRHKRGTKVSLRYRRRSSIQDTFIVIGTEQTQFRADRY
jgi:PDZ domain-containing secreted protein